MRCWKLFRRREHRQADPRRGSGLARRGRLARPACRPSLGSGNQRARSNASLTRGSSAGRVSIDASTARAASSWRPRTRSGALAGGGPPCNASAREGRGSGAGVAVLPVAGVGVEAVVREQLPAVIGHEMDCLQDVTEGDVAHEVREAEPREGQLGADVTVVDLRVHACRPLVVDRIHAVDVGAGAEAAAARLDSEEVAEDRDDEVGVEQTAVDAGCRARRSPADRRPGCRGSRSAGSPPRMRARGGRGRARGGGSRRCRRPP